MILDTKSWRLGMRSINVTATAEGEQVPNTPMRMLIRTYPDLAETIFDRCISDRTKTVHMDFEFIEDNFSLVKQTTSSGRTVFYQKEVTEQDNLQFYDSSATLCMINHPLMIMVQVSCDWCRARHVTACSSLIGPCRRSRSSCCATRSASPCSGGSGSCWEGIHNYPHYIRG